MWLYGLRNQGTAVLQQIVWSKYNRDGEKPYHTALGYSEEWLRHSLHCFAFVIDIRLVFEMVSTMCDNSLIESCWWSERNHGFIERIRKQPWIVWSYFISLSSPWVHVRLEALTHYTQNCIKSSYLHYTLQLFVTTSATFSTVLYMGNNFRNDFFRRIFAVLCVVV